MVERIAFVELNVMEVGDVETNEDVQGTSGSHRILSLRRPLVEDWEDR